MKGPTLTALLFVVSALFAPGCGDPPTTTADRIQAGLASFQGADPVEDSVPAVASAREKLSAGDFAGAVEILTAVAPQEPSGEAWFLLGYAHQQLKQHGLAVAPYLRSIDAGPGFARAPQVFFLLGRCLQETGDLSGARAAYEADGALFPDKGDGAYRLALLDLEDGRLEESETHARQALERFERPQDMAKVHAHLAELELSRGDLAGARTELERCVEIYPHYEVFYKLSRVCTRQGDDAAATRYLALHEEWKRRAGR